MRFLVLLLFIFLSSCGGGGSTPTPTPDSPIQNPTFSWEVVTPESQGLSAAKVNAAMNFATEDGRYTQAALIIKNGKIVAEQLFLNADVRVSVDFSWLFSGGNC